MITDIGSPRTAASSLAEFRLIPRIETYPKVISFAQTSAGRITVLTTFGLGLRFLVYDWPSVLQLVLLLAVATFMPENRRFILAVGPIALVTLQLLHTPLLLALNLGVITSGILLYWCARRWPKSRFGRRPIVFLLSGFSLLILCGCAATAHSLSHRIIWSLVEAVAAYVWFIGYALMDRNSVPANDLTLELAAFHPLWGSTNTPYPKGAAYLRRIEAQNSEQLAIVQLKGLKLLAWAILLTVFQSGWLRFFHGYLHIPTADQALAMSAWGTPVAWHLRWESQILSFFESILEVSVFGHRIIACCRMAGYNALRNTYRPLSSTTMAEFFNRFYYYFKELLVDFFFYPAFFRYWKGNPRLRLVFATFSAAFFGNAFYHFTRDWRAIQDVGLWKALTDYQAFFFYCAVLATMVSISQIRKRGPRPKDLIRGRILPTFSVCLCFCLLNVFTWSEVKYPLLVHLRYFASLFFIHF